MSCKTKWELDFVEEAIGSTFFKNDFKKAQSNTYYEFEKSQLPLVQDNVREFLFNEKKQNAIDNINTENKNKLVGQYGCYHCVGSIYCNDNCNDCCVLLSKQDEIHRDNVRKMNYYWHMPDKYKLITKELKINDFWKHKINLRCLCNNSNIIVNKNDLTQYMCNDQKCNNKYCKLCIQLLNEDGTHKNNECIPLKEKRCPCVKYTCDKCIIDINKTLCIKIRSLRLNASAASAEDPERKKFIMKCQAANCPGFLSTQYKCGVCDVYTCSECLDIKSDEQHVCKPENIESAKMIKKDTKPCPTCATRIYKIDGCDQMWCVDCKTAFSWNTGQISNSKIHNPHYYEYLRKTQGSVPRDPADIPAGCGYFPTLFEVRSLLDKLGTNPSLSKKTLYSDLSFEQISSITNKVTNLYSIFVLNVSEFHRFIIEMDGLIDDNNVNIYNDELIRCRVLHSLGRMNIDIFKRNTYMYHQKSQHHNNYIQTMQMFKQICRDMFGFIIDILRNLQNLNELSDELSDQSVSVLSSTNTKNNKNSLPTLELRILQYTYLLDINTKLNDILKQLMSSIKYVKSNLPINKYYTNDCDKAGIIIKMRSFDEDELINYLDYKSHIKKKNVLPDMIKWDKFAYLFELKFTENLPAVQHLL
jgi:hypothetical protein